jgi:hypothetical protein
MLRVIALVFMPDLAGLIVKNRRRSMATMGILQLRTVNDRVNKGWKPGKFICGQAPGRKKAGPVDPALSLIAESRRQIKEAIFMPLTIKSGCLKKTT